MFLNDKTMPRYFGFLSSTIGLPDWMETIILKTTTPATMKIKSRQTLRQPSLQITFLLIWLLTNLFWVCVLNWRASSCVFQPKQDDARHLLRGSSDGWSTVQVFYGVSEEVKRWQSQVKQDRIVAALTRQKQGGFFVDLAANDAKILSNTVGLEQKLNWNGKTVECCGSASSDSLFARRFLRALYRGQPHVLGRSECAKVSAYCGCSGPNSKREGLL